MGAQLPRDNKTYTTTQEALPHLWQGFLLSRNRTFVLCYVIHNTIQLRKSLYNPPTRLASAPAPVSCAWYCVGVLRRCIARQAVRIERLFYGSGIKKRPLKSAVFFVQDVLICHTLPRIITVCGIHRRVPDYPILKCFLNDVFAVAPEPLYYVEIIFPVWGLFCFNPPCFFDCLKFAHLLSPRLLS